MYKKIDENEGFMSENIKKDTCVTFIFREYASKRLTLKMNNGILV